MLLRAVAACALGAQLAVAAPPAFEDVTVYRLSPKSGDAAVSGLTNVDSGNAAGDALFGLSNLLLPQLCAVEPSFLWCENRGSLSGGGAHLHTPRPREFPLRERACPARPLRGVAVP